MNFALRYRCFALVSILVNLATQQPSLAAYSDAYAMAVAVLCGTGAGLVTKYVLDKKYIFGFKPAHAAEDIGTFLLYTGTGVCTTAIFWGFEFGFDYLFNDKTARYSGAVIALTLGYFIKYRLDKHLVFVAGTTP